MYGVLVEHNDYAACTDYNCGVFAKYVSFPIDVASNLNHSLQGQISEIDSESFELFDLTPPTVLSHCGILLSDDQLELSLSDDPQDKKKTRAQEANLDFFTEATSSSGGDFGYWLDRMYFLG
jgi:hypothetical protein